MTAQSDPDVELMLRFQKGDRGAFEELVRRHSRGVLNLVYRYLGDASGAEDAAQDVFVKVYRARKNYRPSAKFTTWLYRIAVNHCLNELRSRKAQPPTAAPIDDILEEPSSAAPDASLRRQELRRDVKEAIDALSPNQRMAVLLARFHDMSYEEIAETMGLTLEAVKSVLHRAKESLQRRLAKYAGPS